MELIPWKNERVVRGRPRKLVEEGALNTPDQRVRSGMDEVPRDESFCFTFLGRKVKNKKYVSRAFGSLGGSKEQEDG
ncbi:MAG: hypothetical protein ACHQT7_02115 [Candidatus Levyibacteriota bacterium]